MESIPACGTLWRCPCTFVTVSAQRLYCMEKGDEIERFTTTLHTSKTIPQTQNDVRMLILQGSSRQGCHNVVGHTLCPVGSAGWWCDSYGKTCGYMHAFLRSCFANHGWIWFAAHPGTSPRILPSNHAASTEFCCSQQRISGSSWESGGQKLMAAHSETPPPSPCW